MPDDVGEVEAAGHPKRVVLGVTGGIAAYKAIEVCRRLVDAGVHVSPVMTKDAQRFVGPVTLSALASEPVRTRLWDDKDPIPHTRLGQNADAIVVVPATAQFIASYANGFSYSLLTATVLATRAPVIICPAMHTEMWEHPAVRQNLSVLESRGVHIVHPEAGRLAGGDVGQGRLADPTRIVERVLAVLSDASRRHDLSGVRILVSAGGTREAIDPVRFITNRSSGKQGHAVAEEARRRGADVTLVTTTDRPVAQGIKVVPVESAAQMHDAMVSGFAEADVIVMAAAVADFRPKVASEHKLSKSEGVPEIVLEPTPDILSDLAGRRRPGQIVVGFAAETREVVERALRKMSAKSLDFIVANDVTAAGAGFEHDTNSVVIIDPDGSHLETGLVAKTAVAAALLDKVAAHLAHSSKSST